MLSTTLCGAIWVAADEEEMADVWRQRDYHSERGIASAGLDEQGGF